MVLSITDLKKGIIFEFEGAPYKVIEYSQKVMGRGGSIVNVRIKSLLDGRVHNKTFKGNEQLRDADIANREVQYLYKTDDTYYFMDNESFEQFELGNEIIGERGNYIKDGDLVQALLWNGKIVNVDLPKNIPLKITAAEEAVKGDTSSALTKNATLETGVRIKVPAFIKKGDVVSVDTATGSYRERVKD